ncbi:hypothetical protein F909_02002 [Acinetobacter sp. ANC 3929]|uniref:DUF6500 family protein n=1 Tax=unclassified Acinetobacter TaxID=196816 RepID=UPI0002CFF611|nr:MULTISPECIES: DUF6500 family protein [unclassified Acinetobacter]ENW80714.1 hypothetical protein F909_02002 [Acinetobacter sp. ANC 3929]MCH7352139.1 DUF6500 family protein [Acinetobacter sp. NIPH 2023]MCH7354192.1 DUF6500 family protein [Acinetobacter sp. NIPH 1958]MCH7358819.1 DUF6500 family protein [Acinetobacter sp. NIPH 2024]
MRTGLKAKIIQVCDEKIAKNGDNVGLSFYAFFANKNDDPERLMEAAHWWIMQHQLNHFEKATKIKALILAQADERPDLKHNTPRR